jgi:hypothetical protein
MLHAIDGSGPERVCTTVLTKEGPRVSAWPLSPSTPSTPASPRPPSPPASQSKLDYYNPDKAVLTVTDGQAEFHVYLPASARPKNIAGVIATVADYHIASRQQPAAGLFAADFVAAVQPRTRLRLAASRTAYLGSADYTYRVTLVSVSELTVEVRRVKTAVEQPTASFLGDLKAFGDWAQRQSPYEEVLGRIVRFYYDGGSEPGLRVVKLDEVLPKEDHWLLKGRDLKKESTDNFRAYCSRKIIGDILLID